MIPLLGRAEALERVTRALAAAKGFGATQSEAVLMTDVSALTRYAVDRIHQHVGERNAELRIRAVVEARGAVAAGNRLDPQGIDELAERAVSMAKASEPDTGLEVMPESPGGGYVDQTTYYESTARLDADERATVVGEILHRLSEAGQDGFGALTNGVSELAVANSHGIKAYQAFTDVWLSVIARAREGADGRQPPSGYATAANRDWVEVDPQLVASAAMEKAAPGERLEVPPGRYRVLFEEEAAAELLSYLGYLAFNGLAFEEGRSLFSGKLGEPRYPSLLTVRDDPTDVRGANLSFDFEGVAKAPYTLIREGRVERVVWDTLRAKQSREKWAPGEESTGHALPAPNTYGPMPYNLVLAGGGSDRQELLRTLGHGLLVTRFHYSNTVDPAKTLLTGMTRDGTFLVEEGRIVARTQDLRWVDSVDSLLKSLIAVGERPRLISEGPGYDLRFLSGVLAAALVCESFHVTGSA